jgi:hypothetical protein
VGYIDCISILIIIGEIAYKSESDELLDSSKPTILSNLPTYGGMLAKEQLVSLH